MMKKGRPTANEIVLERVQQRLQHGRLTGQIILHVNDGNIRKTETRDFETTKDLLTKQAGSS